MDTKTSISWHKRYTDHILEIADMVNEISWGKYKSLIIYKPENINNIHNCFISNHGYMKSKMVDDTGYLDRFKILSSYTKSLLAYPLFIVDVDKVEEFLIDMPILYRIKYPNEYLVFKVIRSIMHDFCSSVKKNMWDVEHYHFFHPALLYSLARDIGKEGKFTTHIIGFDEALIKFLYYYGHKDSIDEFPLFAFSKILLLLEIVNDCAHFGLKEKYFPVNGEQKIIMD